MRIKEVEELVGITKKNIRYYEQEGLLTPGRNSENSYREYDDEDIARLKQIKLLRKLGIPISEIRDVLESRISLPVAANRHIASIDGEIASLSNAREVCREIADGSAVLDSEDIDRYLERMETLEKEGAIFVNIKNRDVKKRYAGAIAAGCVIVVVILAAIVGLIAAHFAIGLPIAFMLVCIGVLLLVALGTGAALVSRIKELRKGETDDLSKY
jgi:DNA-binding transcriptional MerR regulator